jgi:hypothetical protein
MCEPATIMATMAIASTAIGVGSSVMEHDAQRRYANTQRDLQDQAIRDQSKEIRDNFGFEDASVVAQQGEIDRQATGQASERARQAMIERGRLVAAFSSNGGGGSAQRAIHNSDYTLGADMATIESNRSSNIAQTQRQRSSIARSANSQEARMYAQRQTFAKPTLLGTGLKIAGQVVNGASMYYGGLPRTPSNKAS